MSHLAAYQRIKRLAAARYAAALLRAGKKVHLAYIDKDGKCRVDPIVAVLEPRP